MTNSWFFHWHVQHVFFCQFCSGDQPLVRFPLQKKEESHETVMGRCENRVKRLSAKIGSPGTNSLCKLAFSAIATSGTTCAWIQNTCDISILCYTRDSLDCMSAAVVAAIPSMSWSSESTSVFSFPQGSSVHCCWNTAIHKTLHYSAKDKKISVKSTPKERNDFATNRLSI